MRSVGVWFYNHKTKITGLLMVVIGSLQANSAVLEQLLSPKQFAWFTVGAGVVVAGLGFLNSQKPTIEQKK
jgi:hypothetical protein